MRKWGWFGATLLVFTIESAFGGRAFVVATNGSDANATSSQAQVSTSSSFLANVIDQNGITGTSYLLSSLGFSTTYFWRVRALNAAGASPWSSVRQFATAADTGIAPKGTDNVVANGGFENGATSWSFLTNGTGFFTAASPGFEGSLAGMINITQAGDNMQLLQAGIILEPTTIYRLAFTAYSNSAHGFTAGLLKTMAPYTDYGLHARKFQLSGLCHKFGDVLFPGLSG